MKYIIEIKPEYEDSFKGLMILGAKDSNLFVDTLAVEDLEELNSDYINEHFGDLQDTAYKKGLHDGESKCRYCNEYQRGLNDAWEAAKKVVLSPGDGGTGLQNLVAIFGTNTMELVFINNSASEAIAKLKAYEEKQNADEEIKVGDEVEVINSGNKYTITWIVGTALRGFGHDGLMCHLSPKDVRKTGRHFNIDKILEEMRS